MPLWRHFGRTKIRKHALPVPLDPASQAGSNGIGIFQEFFTDSIAAL